jgi:ABC-type uncharacterized transport system permease subunit
MKYRIFFLLGVLCFLLIPSCTNGVYDPKKGDAFVAATTNPALTVGAPVVATAIGGPAAGAGTAAVVAAFGAVAGLVVSFLNHRKSSDTNTTVNDIATTVTDVATAVTKAASPAGVPAKM